MYAGSYGAPVNPAAVANFQQALTRSTFSRASELPFKSESIDIDLSPTLNEILADSSNATWKPVAGSAYNNQLLDKTEKGIACGDLRRTLLHGLVANNAFTDLNAVLKFTVSDVPGAHITAAGERFSGTLLPNQTIPEQVVFTRPPGVVTEALIGLMNLSEQAAQDSFVTMTGENKNIVDWGVVKGSTAALVAVHPQHVEEAKRNQLEEWIANGGNPATFVCQEPWLEPAREGLKYLSLAPAYWERIKAICMKTAAQNSTASSKFYTNLATLRVTFSPSRGSWAELAARLCRNQASAVCDQILNTPFNISLKIVPSFTICEGEVWEKTVSSMRTSQAQAGALISGAVPMPMSN